MKWVNSSQQMDTVHTHTHLFQFSPSVVWGWPKRPDWRRWSHAFQLCSRLWGHPARVMFHTHVSAPLKKKKKRKRQTVFGKIHKSLSQIWIWMSSVYLEITSSLFFVFFSLLNRVNLDASALIAATQKHVRWLKKPNPFRGPSAVHSSFITGRKVCRIKWSLIQCTVFMDGWGWSWLVSSGLFTRSSGLKCQIWFVLSVYVRFRTVPSCILLYFWGVHSYRRK